MIHTLKKAETKLLREHASTFCYNKPEYVSIEITTRCDLSCVWCPRYFKTVTEDMQVDTFRRIVESIDYVEKLYPCGIGEPLLHKDFDTCIKLAAEHSSYTGIATNGLHLNRCNIERLNASGLSELAVSIDGSDNEGYLKIRNGSDYGLLINNLRLYAKYGKTPLTIHTVIGEPNLRSVENLPELAQSLGVRKIEFNIVHPPPGLTNLLPDPVQLRRTLTALKLKCMDLKIENNINIFLKPQPMDSCFAPFFDCSIDSEGYIGPCCSYPQMRLGNVLKEGFWMAWNGEAFRKFRGDAKKGILNEWCSAYCLAFRDTVNQMVALP
jgi:MoaA/NifB/PqqE/SkfB family radical SAM enzyme